MTNGSGFSSWAYGILSYKTSTVDFFKLDRGDNLLEARMR